MEEQIQKAVDCYEAGATVLHLHVREDDGKGSKRLSKFNELIAGVRERVPEMIIQVGGSISFAPEGPDGEAKWLSDDTRHMLAELTRARSGDGDRQHHADERDRACRRRRLPRCLARLPHLHKTYKDMIVPSNPSFVEEHIRRLSEKGIQSAFQVYNINSFETIERMIRRGVYKGPLVMNWVAISGGMDQANIYNLANMLRAVPDNAIVTVESSVLNVLPINMIGMALGLHVRCGIEDVLWNQTRTGKMSTVEQIRQLVRIAGEFGRPIATAQQAARSSRSACSTKPPTKPWPGTASRPTARAPTRAFCASPWTLWPESQSPGDWAGSSAKG
jgi:uncharacterized protein (DUF849 family)